MTSPKTEMKLPLRVGKPGTGECSDEIYAADGVLVADAYGLPTEFAEARAAYIVLCVNQREEMVEALRIAEDMICGEFCGTTKHNPACVQVGAILAKVEAGEGK